MEPMPLLEHDDVIFLSLFTCGRWNAVGVFLPLIYCWRTLLDSEGQGPSNLDMFDTGQERMDVQSSLLHPGACRHTPVFNPAESGSPLVRVIGQKCNKFVLVQIYINLLRFPNGAAPSPSCSPETGHVSIFNPYNRYG
ncbi:hypothetical protein CDAR_557291 [Caerostris darwini]|uniref:Uncharacterized protein n=1 Tax=Caerostris darwini TaxID=1538125 RepID=A0AAV4P4T2_9ARAC|nr:hypothetical protein CDAR_557291 [Caerostris darwini]